MNVAPFNKDLASGKIPKINKRSPTFIPDCRVSTSEIATILNFESFQLFFKIYESP